MSAHALAVKCAKFFHDSLAPLELCDADTLAFRAAEHGRCAVVNSSHGSYDDGDEVGVDGSELPVTRRRCPVSAWESGKETNKDESK